MTVRGAVTIAVGIVVFVIVDSLITNMITGTDSGSTLLQNTLRVIVAAVILISTVMMLGKSK